MARNIHHGSQLDRRRAYEIWEFTKSAADELGSGDRVVSPQGGTPASLPDVWPPGSLRRR